jgi:mannose-6-phosphate isomerase-like protein (cupin superfamily)
MTEENAEAGRRRVVVLGPGEGRELSLGEGQLCFKADEIEADGRYAISVAMVAPDDPGTTAHLHREHDDLSFVIEGTLAFTVDDETFEAPTGSFVLIPRGLLHRWWNPSSEPAAFLNVHIPGYGFEEFIRELADLSAVGRASPEAMAALGERHDVYFDREALGSRYAD